MTDHFRYPIVNPYIGSSRVTQTYASVTRSILKRISEWVPIVNGEAGVGIPKVHGKSVCPPAGHFEIILYPGRNKKKTDDNGEDEDRRNVRLWFSYPNAYLEAFKSNGVWHRFSDMHPAIVDPDAPPHRYQVVPLPFQSGYHRRGLIADWEVLRFGTTTTFDIYKVLRDYPNNPGGLWELRVFLTKSTAIFSEALRFPQLREALIYQMKFLEGTTISSFSGYFNKWEDLCLAIRRGPEQFKPICGAETFLQLLSLVGLLLHQD